MPTLVEMRTEMDTKRKALAAIFAEAGPERDYGKITLITGTTQEKRDQIIKRNEELTALAKSIEDEASIEGVFSGLSDLEKKMRTPEGTSPFKVPNPDGKGSGDEGVFKSLGQLFVESDAYKKFNRAEQKSPSAEIKLSDDALAWYLGRKATLDTTAWAPQSVRLPRIVEGALRRPVVGDLIPDGQTTQNAIKYMEETTTTNAAAPVAEAGQKPESALAFTEKTSSVIKIATVLPVTDEMFEDEPQARSYVEARLRLFLQLAEEAQLVSGSGTPPAMRGLLNTSGILTQAVGSDPVPDAIYKAMIQIETNSFLSASGVIMHPLDWQDIRLLRTVDGIYIWGNPSEAGPERIWGIDVVRTTAMTQNTALVGAFDTATQKFRRNEVSFAVSNQHADFFQYNKLMLRIEERLALVVYRPTGLCKVTGV